MIGFLNRNLKVFFKDKSTVFFSLLSVFIIIGLYALFLSDMLVKSFDQIPKARQMVDSWISAGLLAVTSVTSTLGAFGIMIDDKVKKIEKDFYSSPVKRSTFAAGYVLNAFIVGVIMCVITAVLTQLYFLSNGGNLLSAEKLLQVFLLILLSCIANNALIFLFVIFFRSTNAFATASTIVGTMIGFLTGIYVPVGSLPNAVQFFIKLFPPSHSAALFRKVIMDDALRESFQGMPPQAKSEVKQLLGVTFRLDDYTISPLMSILYLLITAVVFYGISILLLSRKKR